MREPTIEEKAYLAGIVDGEGYIAILKNPYRNRPLPGYKAVVKITMTVTPVLKLLHEIYGSKIHTYVPRNPKHAASYTVDMCGQDAYRFILHILPYLRIKDENARVLIEYMEKRKDSSRHPHNSPLGPSIHRHNRTIAEDCFERCRVLNRRGHKGPPEKIAQEALPILNLTPRLFP